MNLPVNEIFDTVQGEAFWTGTPALFIRLQGCDVGCPWCDTKHTWALDDEFQWQLSAVLAKEKDSPHFAVVDSDVLATLAYDRGARHVVITGGEPCDHDLIPLTRRLTALGIMAQVETSGTANIRVHDNAWVTLSPKFDMPGGLVVRPQSIDRADEIKMPVGKQTDVDQLNEWLDQHGTPARLIGRGPRYRTRIWLQPLSQSEKATALCIEQARLHGYRVSIQTHKFLGVR